MTRGATTGLVIIGALLALSACGGETESEGVPPGGGGQGGMPATEAGLGPWPCEAGELELADGGCLPAGVPADGCGQGFAHDGDADCVPILPEAPCALGTMALPGETDCRPVAACANGTWGGIPIELHNVFVDGSYAGGDSDGSQDKPWTTIQDGIAGVAAGKIVAIAAGTYQQDVLIAGKPVRLWGVCPELVTIVGQGTADAAVRVEGNADGSELHAIAITNPTGDGHGVKVQGAEDVRIEQVWIHDTGGSGVAAPLPDFGSSLTLHDSLIEKAGNVGVQLGGSKATVSTSVIRDVFAASVNSPGRGRGIQVTDDMLAGDRGELLLSGSIVERTRDAGILNIGGIVEVEDSLVRDISPASSDSLGGIGIVAVRRVATGKRGQLQVRGSRIERVRCEAIYLASSDASIETSVLSDVDECAHQNPFGMGINTDSDNMIDGSSLTVRSSLIDQVYAAAIEVYGSEATIEAVAIRNIKASTKGEQAGRLGYGIGVESIGSDPRGSAIIRGVSISHATEMGIMVLGADAIIESTLVADTDLGPDNAFGQGILVQTTHESVPATLTIARTRIERTRPVGLMVFGAEATIDSVAVMDTDAALVGDDIGYGILVQQHWTTLTPATAAISRSQVERSKVGGIAVYAASATIDDTLVRDTRAGGVFGNVGDGMLVSSWLLLGDIQLADARITGCWVDGSPRAGISNFGGQLALGDSLLSCNAIDLDGELLREWPYTFEDLGGNSCLCGDTQQPCKVLSSQLEPPEPVEPIEQ